MDALVTVGDSTVAHPSVSQPLIGGSAFQIRPDDTNLFANVAPPSNLDQMSGLVGRMPRIIRRRSAPAAHQLATDEVGDEAIDAADPELRVRYADLGNLMI